MKIVKLNIGLENNPYDFESIQWIFGASSTSRVQIGEYNGEPERTAVVLAKVENDFDVLEYVAKMALSFTQECIAVKIDDVGYLVYNPNFEGEKLEFDNQYFIEP